MRTWNLLFLTLITTSAFGTITFTAVDNGDQRITISYSSDAGDAPRGIALRVDVSAPVTVRLAEFTVDSAFNTYMDYAHSNPLNFAVGDGHPFADATEAGALGEDDVTSFSISMGVLDEAGEQAAGPEAADLITFRLCCAGTVHITICGDTLRGPDSDVVGADGQIDSNLQVGCIEMDVRLDLIESCSDCPGDVDGDCDCDAADVGVAVGGWNDYNGMTGGIPNRCADTDWDGDVDAADIGNLIHCWNNGCGECTPISR
ncbi:MAG: hypothetical protein JXA82_08065 [Sedimentisphaerales bacterium]|nr:hypothetical protein [Sedimentisphaerales bacterium]